LQKYMSKACSEISAINVQLFLSWNVNVLTTRTVYFDSGS
jgi:hypothetical protein